MTTYVYIKSEPGLWTVGFYGPNGTWSPESDHNDREEAAKRVATLNGVIPYTEFAKANITSEPDYKALYLEGRELLEATMRIKYLWVPEYPVSEKHMGEAQALYNMAARISEFLTKHNVTPNRDGE